MPDGEEWKTHSSSGSRVPLSGLSSYFSSLVTLLMTTFMLESRVCRTYGCGGDHHSLLPRGPGSSLVFTSMKSECPAYARGGWGIRGFQMTGALATGLNNLLAKVANLLVSIPRPIPLQIENFARNMAQLTFSTCRR